MKNTLSQQQLENDFIWVLFPVSSPTSVKKEFHFCREWIKDKHNKKYLNFSKNRKLDPALDISLGQCIGIIPPTSEYRKAYDRILLKWQRMIVDGAGLNPSMHTKFYEQCEQEINELKASTPQCEQTYLSPTQYFVVVRFPKVCSKDAMEFMLKFNVKVAEYQSIKDFLKHPNESEFNAV